MPFGLSQTDIALICTVLKQYNGIEKAIIFGSRAKNTHKKGSDIDIALKGHISWEIVSAIKAKLEDNLPLPYFFDVVDYDALSNPDLKAHINRVGHIIYKK